MCLIIRENPAQDETFVPVSEQVYAFKYKHGYSDPFIITNIIEYDDEHRPLLCEIIYPRFRLREDGSLEIGKTNTETLYSRRKCLDPSESDSSDCGECRNCLYMQEIIDMTFESISSTDELINEAVFLKEKYSYCYNLTILSKGECVSYQRVDLESIFLNPEEDKALQDHFNDSDFESDIFDFDE